MRSDSSTSRQSELHVLCRNFRLSETMHLVMEQTTELVIWSAQLRRGRGQEEKRMKIKERGYCCQSRNTNLSVIEIISYLQIILTENNTCADAWSSHLEGIHSHSNFTPPKKEQGIPEEEHHFSCAVNTNKRWSNKIKSIDKLKSD